jgi:hypothetical protein
MLRLSINLQRPNFMFSTVNVPKYIRSLSWKNQEQQAIAASTIIEYIQNIN